MIRASLLCLTCLGILSSLGGINGVSEIPACEDKAPTDIYLDLSNVGLRQISKSLTSSSSITCLNLADNDISTLAEESFNGLPELRYLNLARNPRLSFEEIMKTALPNLKSLVFDGSYPIRSASYARNYNARSSFNLPELQKLSLNYNSQIDGIKKLLFTVDAPKLTHLYLSGNKLRSVFNKMLDMPQLTHLYLDENDMENFNEPLLQNLQHLSMDRNAIHKLCSHHCYPNGFSTLGMHNLKHLSLEGNGIGDIESDAFEDFENLRVLNLAQNAIQHFPRHALDNMTNLKNLTLDGNKLTNVPVICALKVLEVLSLNGNQITFFDETFCSLPKLAILRLRNNQLNKIADQTFASLPALLVLDLSANNIQLLAKNWIPANSSLTELYLDSNMFTDLESMSLKHIKNLKLLSIGHNPIKIISIESLLELPQIISIDVSRDCEPRL